MSERTAADDIADAFADARPTFYENFLSDHYELLADVPTEDEYGGRTDVEQVVESGRCKLDVAARQGSEGGTVVQGIGPYVVDLPVGTVATTAHRIRIDGREFAIVSPPKRAGAFGVFVRAELEERSRG